MPDTPHISLRIFISYSHADSSFVDRLEDDLRKQGFDPWVDRQRLAGGVRWRRELQEAVKHAQVLLVVLSPEAVTSENVQIEYGFVLELGKIVIPLYYRQCEIPMELHAIQWIDFRHTYEHGLAQLLATLHLQQQISSTSSSALTTAVAPEVPSSKQEPVGALSRSGGVASYSLAPGERPWNLPFARNSFFTGRGQLLEQLHKQLFGTHTTTFHQSYALSGLGGIGKTQTAIEYAYRYRGEYSAVFWVRADKRETLVTDYVDIARKLSLPEQDAQDQMQTVSTVKRWLEQHQGWLLVLDNADELSLLNDFLPTEGQGHLLLTTRAQATGKLAQKSLPVDKMDLAESMQLLLHRAKVLDPDEPLDNLSRTMRKAARQLVEELDGLPLALDQAGAYIEETGCSLSEYLELYEGHHLALLQQQSAVSADYPHTVANTWALSFNQVEQQDATAADLLRLCAFLHPDAIPEEILTQGAADLGSLLAPISSDPLLLYGAVQLLRHYSLIKRDSDTRQLNIHRLVQVVLRESLDQAAQQQWAERSTRAVNRTFPEVTFASWERCQRCLPHALLCAQWIEHYGFTFPEAARLLQAAGIYLRDRGQYAQAEPLLKRALSLRQQVLGPEHPDTYSTLNALADLYILHGNYQQAERLLQPALAKFEDVLGADHPELARSLDILAAAYLYQGKYAEAEPLFRRALAIREKMLGNSHPDVAESLNNLAAFFYQQGKYAQAQPLYQRALTIYEQALGTEHPDTAAAVNNLANLYRDQGYYQQAEPLYQRALTINEQALGHNHPYTAFVLDNLANLYRNQGNYQQAEPLYQRALAIREKALGNNHPDMARSLHHLAELYEKQGKYEQARSFYQQALSIREQALGADHPDSKATQEALIRMIQLLQSQVEQGATSQSSSVPPA